MPVAVVATAGTTLTGAIDPIAAIADVCAARGVWLHVDGAYGLPAAAVPAMREPRFAGLERADSASVDAHKWLYLPKACGVVLVRDARRSRPTLRARRGATCCTTSSSRHAVDTTLEYSRPFRALKLWLAFRAHGAEAFRAAIERNLDQARAAARGRCGSATTSSCWSSPPLSIVPFRHVPAGVTDLDAHNLRLARALMQRGGRCTWRRR